MQKIPRYHRKRYYMSLSVEEYLYAIRFISRNELLKKKEFEHKVIDGNWVIISKDETEEWKNGNIRDEWERLKSAIYHQRQKAKGV